MSEEVLKTIRERRSIRKYLDKPVPEEVLQKVIDCGRYAPSAHNRQPWEFVVVTDPELKKNVAHLTDFGRFIADAPACIVIFCEETRFFVEDGAAAAMNIILAAQASGLGTCWVAGDKKDYAQEVSRLLEAPPGMRLHTLIPIGYPLHTKRPRQPQEKRIHWNKFQPDF